MSVEKGVQIATNLCFLANLALSWTVVMAVYALDDTVMRNIFLHFSKNVQITQRLVHPYCMAVVAVTFRPG